MTIVIGIKRVPTAILITITLLISVSITGVDIFTITINETRYNILYYKRFLILSVYFINLPGELDYYNQYYYNQWSRDWNMEQ